MSAAFTFPVDHNLTELLASDEVYFRAGAVARQLRDCELAYAPGLTHVQAGCVVQCVRFRGTAAQAERWLAEIEPEVAATGASLSRIYLHSSNGPLPAVLARKGYRPRKELAFAADPVHLGLESKVTFHPVKTEAQWAERLRLHVEGPDNSDGYRVDPAAWCELIRRKCESGIKESFLIEYEGRVCGSIGAIQMPGLLRLKNIQIHPDFRRMGLGHEAVHELAALTHRRGLKALAVFGIEGEPGAALYRRAGFQVIGWQTEWCKELDNRSKT